MRFIILPIIALLASCCTPQDGPKPIEGFDRMVRVEFTSWLDLRSDETSLAKIVAEGALWRTAKTLSEVSDFFASLDDPDVWDLPGLMDRLKKSELYTGQDDDHLWAILREVLLNYRGDD